MMKSRIPLTISITSIFHVITLTILTPMNGVEAITCDPCDRSLCHFDDQCADGVVLDSCDCCLECARRVSEECGGRFSLHGKCSEGLVCVITPRKGAPLTGMEVGSCAKIPSRDTNNTFTQQTSAKPLLPKTGEFIVKANPTHDNQRPTFDCSLVNCDNIQPPSSVHSPSSCPPDSYTPSPKKTSNFSASFIPSSSSSSLPSSSSSLPFSSSSSPSSSLLSSLTQKATSVIKFEDIFRYCCDPSKNNNLKNTHNSNLEPSSQTPKNINNKKAQNNHPNAEARSCHCYPCPPQQPLKCPSSQLPHLIVPGNMRPGTCCHHYECIDKEKVCKTILCNDGENESENCPDDSTEIPLDSPFDVCCFKRKGCQCKSESVCIEKEERCLEGMVRRVLEVAKRVPGACCNRYDCINVTLASSFNCTYKNTSKGAGEEWVDGCMHYQCQEGIIIASNVPCPSDQDNEKGNLKCDWMGFQGNNSCCSICKGCVGEDGNFHLNGDSWKPSSCMECRCQKGQRYCQAEMCQSLCSNPVIVPGTCCPICKHNDSFVHLDKTCSLLTDCDLICPNGYKKGVDGCFRCECEKRDGKVDEEASEEGKNNADEDGGEDEDVSEVNKFEDVKDEDDENHNSIPDGCELVCVTGYIKDKVTGRKKCMCIVKIVKENEHMVEEEKYDEGNPNEKNAKKKEDKVGEFEVPSTPKKKIKIKNDDREVVKDNKTIKKEEKKGVVKKGDHVSRCPSLKDCHLQCFYGLQKDLDGCSTCHCNRCPTFECHKRCPSGYQTNNDNCLICKCLHSGPFPALQYPSASPSPPPPPLLPQHKTILDGVMVGRHCVSANEKRLEHGQAWWDGCRRCFCHRGYEMCELVTCPPVQCSSPILLPDKCCLTCPGRDAPAMMDKTGMCLSGEGRLLVEGETWSLDECTFCLCHQGTPLCTIEMCAPLLCHHPIIIPHTCCPVCPHSLDYLNAALLPSNHPSPHFHDNQIATSSSNQGNQSCIFSKTGVTSKHGDVWKVSACQSCYCRNGVIHCFSQTCPILGCHKTVLKKGHCCPSCLDVSAHYCEYNYETYDNRESWLVDDCTTCACMDGHVMCTMSICAATPCAHPVHLSGKCCPVCPGSSKESCPNNKSKKESTQHLNISLIVVLIAIIAILAIAIVVLLIMLLWLKPRLRRSSSLTIRNPLHFFSQSNHVELNDEKSVSSSFLPLNSVSANLPSHLHRITTPSSNNQPPPIQFPPSDHTTIKLGRSSVDGGFDTPFLNAAISSMTTASLASSSSSAAKKRLSSLDGCSGSDEKTVPSETSREDVTKPSLLPPNPPVPSSLPPLPPRRPQSFRGPQNNYYDGGQVVSKKNIYNGEKNDGDDEEEDDEDGGMLPPIPPNHPEEGGEIVKSKLNWHSEHLDSDQSSHLLSNNPDNNNSNSNINNSNSNHNNRRSW